MDWAKCILASYTTNISFQIIYICINTCDQQYKGKGSGGGDSYVALIKAREKIQFLFTL